MGNQASSTTTTTAKESLGKEKDESLVAVEVRGDDSSSDAAAAAPASSSSSFSFQQAQAILAAYDKDGNRQLDAQEIARALQDYENHHHSSSSSSSNNNNNSGNSTPDSNAQTTSNQNHTPSSTAALRALAHYDQNADGTLQTRELERLSADIDTSETILKYLAFCGSLSTLGKIVRAIHSADNNTNHETTTQQQQQQSRLGPSHSNRQSTLWIRQGWNRIRGGLVTGSWRITYAYVVIDTLWEGYKAYSYSSSSHNNNNNNNKYDYTARQMASRAVFNAAMVGTSMVTVKSVVHATYRLLPPRLLRWGDLPPWWIPCTLSTAAVLHIPSRIVAPPLKQGLRRVLGVPQPPLPSTTTTRGSVET